MNKPERLLREGIELLRQQGGEKAVLAFQKDWAAANLEHSLGLFKELGCSSSIILREWAEAELANDLRVAAKIGLKVF